MRKRFLSLLLVLACVLTLAVVPVIAAEEKAIRAFGLASTEEMHRLAQRHLECLQREFETISAFP